MIATILWRSIVSAILPMSLREIVQKLPQIADRLVKLAGNPKHQVDMYRANHHIMSLGLAVGNC